MKAGYDDKTVLAPPPGAGEGDHLRVILPDGTSLRHALAKGPVLLGRDPEAGLRLEHRSVSRRHAVLERQGGGWSVRDLGSANGVLLNGARVGQAGLADGDELVLGEVRIVAVLAAPPAAPAAPAAPAPAEDFAAATVVAGGRPAVPQAAPQAAPAFAGAGRSGSGKARKLLLAGGITALLLLGAIILIASLGDTPPPPPSPAPPGASAPAPAPAAAPAAPATGKGAPPSDPSAAKRHLEEGRALREADRLLEARQEFARAAELDPASQAARTGLKAVGDEIRERAEAAYARGLKNFEFLKYQEAVAEWVRVLNLVPEESDPLHQKAREYLEKARAKLAR